MTTTRISANYEIVIPKEIRELLRLEPGQEVLVTSTGGAIVITPVSPLSAYRGILRGMPTTGYRESDDRF